MARGGKREGAGRPVGAKTKRTREVAENAAHEGLTPVEYMLFVMRDQKADPSRRDAMARAAAPYIHPRLSTVQHSGNVTKSHEEWVDELK